MNLENKIKQEKEKSWSANKKEILREIEKEIVSRYYYQSGKVRYSLQKDAEISEAVSLLTDHKKDQKILKK
ncbi:MAG: hypothetical protein IPK25_17600 [Saprospiraceae bacterium]|nr:hypothetical protein [Saprospiraceae bacterium]